MSATGDHTLHVGISGTFDVQNYGDLLFPLIAEEELSRRLGMVRLRPFSHNARTPTDWPYGVTPLSELPMTAAALDGMMIGGGDVIRFDKQVAPGYGSPTPTIHHPTGYWLTPALLALHHGCPVVWNAPGVHGEIPAWAEPLLRPAIGLSRYVAVRDEGSRQALARFAGAKIAVVPDTGFGIRRLLEATRSSPRLGPRREALAVTRPYVVVQATSGLDAFHRLVRTHLARFRDHRFVALPIGPVLGDCEALVVDQVPNVVCLPTWPHPLQIAELVEGASAVVGTSLHLAITALAFGVPVFRPADAFKEKYAELAGFDGVHPFPAHAAFDPDWFMEHLGRRDVEPAVRAALADLDLHWDRVASIFGTRDDPRATREGMGLVWQSMPNALEADFLHQLAAVAAQAQQCEAACTRIGEQDVAIAHRDAEIVGLNDRLTAAQEAHRLDLAARDATLVDREQVLAAREDRIRILQAELAASRAAAQSSEELLNTLLGSTSWRVTALLRWLGRGRAWFRGTGRRRLLDLERIERHTLATQPYQWACVEGVLSPQDAAELAASYPRDCFKSVAGYDGEKGYEYEARALIHMAATVAANPEGLSKAWRRLADELLSPAYRAALGRLTGHDLTTAPMEAYVCHYGPGAWLGPHVDLKEKILTHVFYFNREWNLGDGGCLSILGSPDMSDVVADIPPIVGSSSILVRSDKSWHAVSRVAEGCRTSRRSMNVIFYRPGAVSTMWPPGDATPLHRYESS